MIAEFFSFVFFIVACIFSFYIPGALSLEYICASLPKDKKFLLSFPIGIALFILCVYCFAWIKIDYACLLVLFGMSLIALIKKRSIFRVYFLHIDLWSVGIIILGSLCFISLTALSGLKIPQGLQFVSDTNASDSLMHVAFIKNLLTHFPPTHTSAISISLTGYHYFYDLLLSRFVLFFHFSPEDLNYRFFSLLTSLLYGIGFYLAASRMTANKISVRLILFFAYFAQGAGSVLFIFNRHINPVNGFGLIQPLETIMDPSVPLSLGIFLSGFYLLSEKKFSYLQAMLVAVLFGVLSELKFYTGFIVMGSLFALSAYALFFSRKNLGKYLFTFLIAGIISAATFLPNNLGSSGGIIFSPFFFYSSLMKEQVFSSWNWEIKRVIYAQHNNWIHISILYLQAFITFWILSLGIRMLFLLKSNALFKKEFWHREENIFFLTSLLLCLIMGSLFVQSQSVFSTIQFFWIISLLIIIPTGEVIGNFLENKSFIKKILVIGLLIAAFFGGNAFLINSYFLHPAPVILTNKQLSMLDTIQKTISKNSYIAVIPQYDPSRRLQIFTLPGHSFTIMPLFAGVKNIPVFYEPEPQLSHTNNPVLIKREKITEALAIAVANCNKNEVADLLKQTETKYIVTYVPSVCIKENPVVAKSIESPDLSLYILK